MNKFFKSFDRFHAENDFALAALHTKVGHYTLHFTPLPPRSITEWTEWSISSTMGLAFAMKSGRQYRDYESFISC